ncbi:hypothetical protein GCM10023211_15210 [Orbus sasakiae]|uniref:Uncharacterized protein n=1 Tax=Orbus sasakiae TaxID=1078475 RepID=A0ABP9N6X0_9GAMM
MNRICLLLLSVLTLTGCHALNFQTEPDIAPQCDYRAMTGIEFKFNQLPDNQQKKGFNHVYVAQSKGSATLPASYQGLKGKLTGQVIERNYPQNYLWGHRGSPFRNSFLYDDDRYDDFYLTARQRQLRERKAKSVFQQAILENCQIVYISVDSLAQDLDNPLLIKRAELNIIHQ